MRRHGIQTARHTFAELADLVQLDYNTKRLLLPSLLQPTADPKEVAVIYYRAAYTPNDYPTADEWGTRLLLERSRAIKCPSMALQLAGAKKVQQVLSEPGVLEDFLLGPDRPDVGFGAGAGDVTEEDLEAIRRTWIGLWPMDDSALGQEAYQLATTQSERFVLKPQREGGGNNIYRDDIPSALESLEKQPRKRGEPAMKEGYILMELIRPPENVHNWLVKGGEGKARYADVVSELGIYGVMLFGADPRKVVNKEAGWLLRTKGRESDEGGVAIGGLLLWCKLTIQVLARLIALYWLTRWKCFVVHEGVGMLVEATFAVSYVHVALLSRCMLQPSKSRPRHRVCAD